MQDRYAGDIGDYLKLSILRALQPGRRLGVAWWLFPNEVHNDDGRFVSYLSQPQKWRHFDSELFDHLADLIQANNRSVRAIEATGTLSGARFESSAIPRTAKDRETWIEALVEKFTDRDIVFFDPDNGLEPSTFRAGTAKAGKSITVAELERFRKSGRCLVVYHHHTRARGGHLEEIRSWTRRLEASFERVDAIRCKPYSPRVYFLLDASQDIRERAHDLTTRWGDCICLNPHR